MTTERLALAARNNALWVDTVCRTHGVRGRLEEGVWSSPTRTPPYYPDAVTLSPDVDAGDLLARVDASDGCSVKDSWSSLDLTGEDFARLAVGQWLWREPGANRGPNLLAQAFGSDRRSWHWRVITTADAMWTWAMAWAAEPDAAGILRPSLVDQAGVHVLAATDADNEADDTDAADAADAADSPVVAGCLINVTGEGGARVAGVSNVFASNGDTSGVYRKAAAFSRSVLGDLPVVGWEAGDGLTAATEAGYEQLGPVTVWVR